MRDWRGPQGLAALGVLAVMVVWRGVLLGGSFFNQDDFYLTGRAYGSDLDLDFLVHDTAGHVNPLQQLCYWLVAHQAPYDWGAVATFVLVLQTVTTVVMWQVLSRLLPGRWIRVPLLAAFAWAPITLATTLWWSAAMGLWPHLLCALVAVLFLLRLRQGAGPAWLNGAVVVAASVVGLLWHERAVLIAPVVLATAVVLTDVPGWRRPFAALRRHWVLWLVHLASLVAYLWAHGRLTDVVGGSTSARESGSIGWAFVGDNVLQGVVGGPWVAQVDGGAVDPPLVVTVLGVLLATVLAGLVLWRGGPGRRWAVAFFVAYVASDLVLVLSGRGGFGRVIGMDPRYSADVIHVAVFCAALAVRGAPPAFGFDRLARSWPRTRTVGIVALTGAYLTACAFGTAALLPHFQNKEDRAYLTAVRDGLAEDPRRTLVDDLAPREVVLPLVGGDSLLSRVLAPLPESPVFDQPSYHLRRVGADGTLLPVTVAGDIRALPAPNRLCGHRVTDEPRRVRFPFGLRGDLLLLVGYFTDEETTVEVAIGSWETVFSARPGPNEVWVPVPELAEPFDEVRLRVRGSTTVCVPHVTAGRAERPE